MHYSACIPAVFAHMPIRQALAQVHAAGLQYYEFWGWNDGEIEEYLAAQEEYRLTPAAMCTREFILTDPTCRGAFLEGLEQTISACRRLGCPAIITQVGQEYAHLSRQAQHESIVAGLKAAAPLLESAGITLVFEPLNTLVDHKGYYLWSSREAFTIADEVGSSRVKVLLDLYHQAVMEDLNLPEVLANLDKIGHFHMAGVPGRHEPLTDCVVDYAVILRAIRQAGYQGAVGLEYFPRQDAAQGLKSLYARLREF